MDGKVLVYDPLTYNFLFKFKDNVIREGKMGRFNFLPIGTYSNKEYICFTYHTGKISVYNIHGMFLNETSSGIKDITEKGMVFKI